MQLEADGKLKKMHGQIVLVGMMGVGKSAVGAALGRHLRVPFVDNDTEIERAAAMPIADIFARDGEPFFRARETEVLGRLLSGPRGVIATGGGAWIQPANRALIREAGLSVWLDADFETLWARVRQRPTRPLLLTENPRETLASLIERRAPIYARADLRFSARAGGDIDAAARALARAIRTARPGFLEEP
ncbi:MAG: shikimate kinase [Paracoccus sp. (in: a-proteobacteria)]|nr:shikimate kinase [Paracoccus sp. (in: a-proteobacteria)]